MSLWEIQKIKNDDNARENGETRPDTRRLGLRRRHAACMRERVVQNHGAICVSMLKVGNTFKNI